MTEKALEKSLTINIEKISNEEKAKEYKAEIEAQTKIEELNMQDANKKWDAMVNICLNGATKVLEKRHQNQIIIGTKVMGLLNYLKNR